MQSRIYNRAKAVAQVQRDLMYANNKVEVQDNFADDLKATAAAADKIINRCVNNGVTYYNIAGFSRAILKITWVNLGKDEFERSEEVVKQL